MNRISIFTSCFLFAIYYHIENRNLPFVLPAWLFSDHDMFSMFNLTLCKGYQFLKNIFLTISLIQYFLKGLFKYIITEPSLLWVSRFLYQISLSSLQILAGILLTLYLSNHNVTWNDVSIIKILFSVQPFSFYPYSIYNLAFCLVSILE